MVWYSCSLLLFEDFLLSSLCCVDNGKLEPRFVKCIFLGYKNGVKGYKLWCLETSKIIVGRDVIFMKLLCCEIYLLMTLVTQVSRSQDCKWSNILE